jgi:hypothetical protein
MGNCADCGASFSEIKNRLLLTSNKSDISKWDEHIYYWIVEAERSIGTFDGLHVVNNYTIKPDSHTTKINLPDDVYMLTDVCFGSQSSMYTGVGSYFNKNCGCGNSNNGSCGCIKWYTNGCYIYTSRSVGEATISYTAIPLDEDGFPYVKQDHVPAILAFIRLQMLQANFDDGKVNGAVYQTRQREWANQLRVARSRDNTPKTDAEMDRLSNIWNSKLPVSYRSNSGRDRSYILVPL